MREFFTLLVGHINGPIFATLDKLIGQANAWVVSWVLPAFALAISIWAIAMAGGIGRFSVSSAAKTFMFIALICAMLQISIYDYYIRDLIMKAIPAGVDAMAGQNIKTTAHAWDVILNQLLDSLWSGWELFSWRTPGHDLIVALMLCVYLICGIACIACGFGTWLKGFVMAALYLVVGIPILPLFIFRTTRPIVVAWLGATLSSVMVQALSVILALLVVGVQTYVLNAIITDTGSSPTARLSMLCAAGILFMIFAWIAKDIPSAAAQLCGGVHYSPYALVSATYGTVQGGAAVALGYAGKFTMGLPSRIVGPPQTPGSQQGPAVPPGQSLSKAYK